MSHPDQQAQPTLTERILGALRPASGQENLYIFDANEMKKVEEIGVPSRAFCEAVTKTLERTKNGR